ncbi:MAG: hypothetical protein ABI691_06080 [Ginsengibacter sp.]
MANSVTHNICADRCDCLLHPFQNDTGISQEQRVMDQLLGGKAKIDARKTADLLDYFYKLSRHLNYYDSNLVVSDWLPFFEKSAPFALASLIKYNLQQVRGNLDLYKLLFRKSPTSSGLQLIQVFIYYNTVKRINDWYLKIKGTELPVERVFESIIKDKLSQPLRSLIILNGLASKRYCVKQIDFSAFFQNKIWGLGSQGDIARSSRTEEESFVLNGDCDTMKELYERTIELFSSLFEPIGILSTAAELSLDESILPLKDELKKKHLPHLGLLFAFLKLFEKLQGDLNGYTKKHLDFFYKEVLKLKPKKEVPDQAYIVFEIQKELDKYLLKKGLKVKDGKDLNKEEILFSLDDDIVVNQAQVKDVKTLYLNNQIRPNPDPAARGKNIAITEGVYIAPDARMADGIDKDFQSEVKNFYTVGNKDSKYVYPGTKVFKPYPNARLGFILASPVLLLSGGRRTVNVTLACQLEDPTDDKDKTGVVCKSGINAGEYPPNYSTKRIFSKVRKAFRNYYVYISEDLVREAIKKGVSIVTINILRNKFLKGSTRDICGKIDIFYIRENAVDWDQWWSDYYKNVVPAEKDVIDELFKRQRIFKILFSGDKAWIEPDQVKKLRFTSLTEDPTSHKKTFSIKFTAVIKDGRPGVTFFNKETLKEDFDTTQPLMKIELNEKIKIRRGFDPAGKGGCCLDKKFDNTKIPVSFYYFLRNVRLLEKTDNDLFTPSYETAINVKVCGLNNFIVQNDESIMDVNGPIYPFGSRPDIIDFDLNKSDTYCITQPLINDADADIGNEARANLKYLVDHSHSQKLKVGKSGLNKFLDQQFSNPNYKFKDSEKEAIKTLLGNPLKNYCNRNYIGPNFYIGSKEVFCKNWTDVSINFNWKDKPADFNEYYVAYQANPEQPETGEQQQFGLDENQFEINLSVLQEGKWKSELEHPRPTPPDPPPPHSPETTLFNTKTNSYNRKLFPTLNSNSFCTSPNGYEQTISLKNTLFENLKSQFNMDAASFNKYTTAEKNGFLKITLQNQDFLHKDYPLVLARQMMALGRYPDALLEGAVYRDASNGTVIVYSNWGNALALLNDKIVTAKGDANSSKTSAKKAFTEFSGDAGFTGTLPIPPADPPKPNPPLTNSVTDPDRDKLFYAIYKAYSKADTSFNDAKAVETQFANLQKLYNLYNTIIDRGKKRPPLNIPIPNEPWTPVIRNISIDYKASATIKDVDLIHLYPYKDTYKHEEIQLQPTLFPTFCDEGTLFIGLEKLVPGNNLNILFQMAEATADSESDKEDVYWDYLDNNTWKPLRTGFEVLEDATEDLTTSGIVTFALPENMTDKNTVMPPGLHWIKATIPKNSRSVSETTGIYAQAMKAIFTNDEANDKLRLGKPIEASQISKLNEADASVKRVTQPYESFGGLVPEEQGQFYVRVSELLRHKGRAIQKFDYERMVLDAFPDIFKAKCINHSFGLNAHFYKNDFPYAPGFVITAVIPDLFKLKAGNAFEPKAPVSLLEKIDSYIRRRTSTFARFRAMNPRYEKIHLSIKVKLAKGKDENYFKEKLAEDIREFLAPWAVGEYHKIAFGQCVRRSEIVRLVESREYIDFILEMNMRHEAELNYVLDTNGIPVQQTEISPKTPRSILIAGDVEVCIEDKGCGNWNNDEKCNNQKIKLISYCRDINT